MAFVSSIIGQISVDTPLQYPVFTWWAVVYILFLIIGIFVVVASDTIQTYHVAIVGYLAAGVTLSSASVNLLIYSTQGSFQASAAGFILLSMVQVRTSSF
jgi:SHO1 osmosensor